MGLCKMDIRFFNKLLFNVPFFLSAGLFALLEACMQTVVALEQLVNYDYILFVLFNHSIHCSGNF